MRRSSIAGFSRVNGAAVCRNAVPNLDTRDLHTHRLCTTIRLRAFKRRIHRAHQPACPSSWFFKWIRWYTCDIDCTMAYTAGKKPLRCNVSTSASGN